MRLIRLPLSVLFRVRVVILKLRKHEVKILNEQNKLFDKLGLDRSLGLNIINRICENNFNYKYSEENGMFSEHLVAMGSISQKYKNYSRILEIGTFDGRSAVVLANLFKNAEIVTIDLPSDSNEYKDIYHRDSSNQIFVKKRNKLLRRYEHINFMEINSINLAKFENDSFDFIWIDGAHGYPVVSIDIINACRLVRKGGIIMLDDVHKFVRKSDKMYSSVASYEVLKVIKGAGLISDFTLLRKRLGVRFNVKKFTEKFVGIIKF